MSCYSLLDSSRSSLSLPRNTVTQWGRLRSFIRRQLCVPAWMRTNCCLVWHHERPGGERPGGTPAGPRARHTTRGSHDSASRDQAGPAADLESWSGSGAPGARDASLESPTRAQGARDAEWRGAGREPEASPLGGGAARSRSGAETGWPHCRTVRTKPSSVR
jgi:hypothetical protein